MLKIKDNVDLKELEKFGLVYACGHYLKWVEDRGFDIGYCIEPEDRIIKMNFSAFDTKIKIDNTLYDLIKADLVEKVEDKGE